MSTLIPEANPVKPALVESDPATWGPEWDNWFWEPSRFPSPDDANWWAANAPSNAADFDVEPALDEMASLEAAASDCLERGLIPPDLAQMIDRTSLVGLADAILHEGSDVASCRCWSCVEIRTRRYAE